MIAAPPPPFPRLCLGVTGHRVTNAAFMANRATVEAELEALFDTIAAALAAESESLGGLAPARLNTLIATGVDQLAAESALRRGWDLSAPLPFGRELNLAINALPADAGDAQALLRGVLPNDAACADRAGQIAAWYERARLFELADRDAPISRQFLDHLASPADLALSQRFFAALSERVALAGRVMIEQSDFIVAVWDGATHNLGGGTGHTIAAALDLSTPVVWIDPADPAAWRILVAPESLTAPAAPDEDREARLAALVRAAVRPGEGGALQRGARALGEEAWHPRSSRLWTGYRRIEALFGGDGNPLRSLVQTYETPEEIGEGSGAPLLAAARDLAAGDPGFADAIEQQAMRRFAWADGISARLSDHYRGGMIASFVLSALAVAAGMAYQPLAIEKGKWIFALAEFLLLATILSITWLGGRRRWHKRWFETRRVAEYFRHAPILLLLGVARPAGRWPRGNDTAWPEYYARHGLRTVGLPRVRIDAARLRQALSALLDCHVLPQRDYHRAKAARLTHVHHRLDRLSQRLFIAAFLSVSLWLTLAAGAAPGLLPEAWPKNSSKVFTYLGVLFPTLGAAFAGMRYFGDFERFAAISEVTAEKLDAVSGRIRLLLEAPAERLTYGQVSELAHAVDAIVVDEIENWQAVFGGKHISVPA